MIKAPNDAKKRGLARHASFKKWHGMARKTQFRHWHGTARLYGMNGTDGTGIFEKNKTKIQGSAPKLTWNCWCFIPALKARRKCCLFALLPTIFVFLSNYFKHLDSLGTVSIWCGTAGQGAQTRFARHGTVPCRKFGALIMINAELLSAAGFGWGDVLSSYGRYRCPSYYDYWIDNW